MTDDFDPVDDATPEVIRVEAGNTLAYHRVEIDMQIATARQYPRNLDEFRRDLLAMAQDPELADKLSYSVERGGELIVGPSIRLAEAAACFYGNFRTGGRVINVDNDTVTAEAVAHDIQKNVSRTCQVVRSILNRKGKRFSKDMIVVTSNAAIAIATRNAILGVIPRGYVMAAMHAAIRTAQNASGEILARRRASAVKWCEGIGISADDLMTYFGVASVDEIDAKAVTTIAGFKTAIEEGLSSSEQLAAKMSTRGNQRGNGGGAVTADTIAGAAVSVSSPAAAQPQAAPPAAPAAQPQAAPPAAPPQAGPAAQAAQPAPNVAAMLRESIARRTSGQAGMFQNGGKRER